MAKEEQLTTLRTLLGITDDSKNTILTFLIDKGTDMICNYCCIETVPLGIENILLSMCVDMYRVESLGQEKAEGVAKEISEGDVSVSFNSPSALSQDWGRAFLGNYTAQLNRFRKVGW
ncbi:MAG: phage head-tail connector protein [Anaerotignaceae bacterium]